MAIFDRAPVVATIYPAAVVDDGYGGSKPGDGTPVTVRVWVQPMTSEDPNGWSSPERVKILAKVLPAEAWSRVEMMGSRWSVIRQPRTHRATLRTTYTTAELVASPAEITQSQADGNGG